MRGYIFLSVLLILYLSQPYLNLAHELSIMRCTCLPFHSTTEVPRSIRDQMDKRPEAAKALERAIETVLQKIKRESNVSILRRDASAMGLNYSPRLLPLFPEIARLTRLPGGESCALSLILKFAEFACLDLSEPNFSLKHLQDGYFWIDLDKAALQALLKTSSVDWRIMGHAGIQDALKDFDIFRKKVWESSLSLEDQKMNPVFVWTTNFLKEKSERATKGIF